jgi:hypothetical protein
MSETPWKGQAAICVASGPSLTERDCVLAQDSGLKIIAVSNTWQRVPNCDVLYSSDYDWWKKYAKNISIPAERWSNNAKAAIDFKTKTFHGSHGYNSGLTALLLAQHLGAETIYLLGYDAQASKTHQLHWHDPHHRLKNPDESEFRKWLAHYRQATVYYRAKIINCSRSTAITLFPRASLKSALSKNALG